VGWWWRGNLIYPQVQFASLFEAEMPLDLPAQCHRLRLLKNPSHKQAAPSGAASCPFLMSRTSRTINGHSSACQDHKLALASAPPSMLPYRQIYLPFSSGPTIKTHSSPWTSHSQLEFLRARNKFLHPPNPNLDRKASH
jgi:hypothetical protein